MSAPPVLVELTRGPIVEAIHRGDLAIVRADGSTVASVGDPRGKVTYWRSSASWTMQRSRRSPRTPVPS